MKPKQNLCYSDGDIVKCTVVINDIYILIKLYLKSISRRPIDNGWALIQVNACHLFIVRSPPETSEPVYGWISLSQDFNGIKGIAYDDHSQILNWKKLCPLGWVMVVSFVNSQGRTAHQPCGFKSLIAMTTHDHDDVSNHWSLHSSLKGLSRMTKNKYSSFELLMLCESNTSTIIGATAQRNSNDTNVSLLHLHLLSRIMKTIHMTQKVDKKNIDNLNYWPFVL